MPPPNDKGAPLGDASDSDINRMVDDVLRSGKHLTLPPKADTPRPGERYHARAIAEQMHRLAQHISQGAVQPSARDDVDEWWFEVQGKRIGPISLKKLRFLWEEGELTPDSLCWHEGFPKWVSLFKVSELADALTPKLHVNVDDAVRAFARNSSGEWASPAASGMEAANRKKLEAAQKHEPLPLNTPLNLSDERAATYTALKTLSRQEEEEDDEGEEAPRARGGFGYALVSGLVAGLIAAGAIVGVRVLWPMPMVQPIVITMGGPSVPAPPQVAAAPEPAKAAPVAAPAPVPAAAPAAAPAPAGKPAAAPAPAPAEESKKPPTVEDAFAKAFAQAPPDELTTGEVFEVVRAHKSQIDACAAQQKAVSPDDNGRLVMRWTVDTEGKASDVTSATAEMAKSAFAECLAKEIAGWTFPKHAVAHPPVEVPFKY